MNVIKAYLDRHNIFCKIINFEFEIKRKKTFTETILYYQDAPV